MSPREEIQDRSTVTIKIRFMGDLPSVVGGRDATVSVSQGSSVGELVAKLCDRYGDGFRCRLLSRPDSLHHDILIFLNGENIQERGDLAVKLEGDSEMEIIMLPAFEGG